MHPTWMMRTQALRDCGLDEKPAPPAVRPAAIQAKYFDPWQAKAWLGVARTLAMFAVPRSVLSAYRTDQNLRVQPS
jgi:hypothetical protein